MKKRIFSILLALVFACMPLIGVCAAPSMVALENAVELYAEPEQVQVTEEAETYTVCSVAEDGSIVSEIKTVEEYAELSASLRPLPAPTDLRWNENWDEYSMWDTTVPEKYYGFISWNVVPNAEGEYRISVYRNGTEVHSTTWSGIYDDDGNGRIGVSVSDEDMFSTSGAYTFKVVAVGDDMRYSDSPAATSGVYNFTAPSQKLDTPKNVRISGTNVYHSGVHNVSGYKYTFYDQNFHNLGTSWSYGNHPLEYQETVIWDLSHRLKDFANNPNRKPTKIYVTVTALTYNITLYQSGVESGYSNSYNMDGVNEEISGELDEDAMDKIVSGELPADEALDNFLGYLDNNDLTNTDLAVSMLRDEDLADNIDILEEKFIEQTGVAVDVKSTASDPNYLSDRGIDVNDISIKGAALNSENNNDVSLTFSEADPSFSADEKFYKNSVAVNIGMEGIKDSQKLDIPVIIEMPVPAGVVAHRLFILHYHADGSVEQIHPAIIEKGGKNYARFILTSFSTFIFCNAEDSVLMGNIYSDDETVPEDANVSIKDLIALAQYVSGHISLSTEQLMVANVYTEDDVVGATVDVNINEKDIEALAQMLV